MTEVYVLASSGSRGMPPAWEILKQIAWPSRAPDEVCEPSKGHGGPLVLRAQGR